MIDGGFSSSIFGRFAVPPTRESSEPLMPGAITTPISSPFSEIISNVVAVPKSIHIIGEPIP